MAGSGENASIAGAAEHVYGTSRYLQNGRASIYRMASHLSNTTDFAMPRERNRLSSRARKLTLDAGVRSCL